MTNHSRPSISWFRAASAALAILLVPLAASAQTAPVKRQAKKTVTEAAPTSEMAPYYGGGIGLNIPFESGMSAGVKLDGFGFYPVLPLGPSAFLDVGGNLALSFNGGDISTVMFDILPTGRARFVVDPLWSVYGDLGLGLGIVHVSSTEVTIPTPFGPITESVGGGTTAAFLLKLGGGAAYKIAPNISIFGEPSFNFYLKSGSITVFTLLFGAQFQM